MSELERIERQISELKDKLSHLEQQRQLLLSQNVSSAPCPENVLSPEQKVALFKSYFRGNEHCYAHRWQNSQGRSGYAVACNNEWQQGLCNKPKVKCLECPNQAFKSFDADVIYNHLTGKEIVGLYPMLSNNTCWLLAVDFDKSDWQLASRAYANACERNGIECLLERSRSGNGAHVWIFFDQAIEAKLARQLGFYLLDEAMKIHGALSFESYDRLFPNQDVLPIGGIGNLIALPLQKQARSCGNSTFVDQSFVAYTDQWAALASIKRLSAMTVERLLNECGHSKSDDANYEAPWERSLAVRGGIQNCPKELSVVIANRLYLPISELPNPLLAQLKKIASFSNPKFFKAQGLRLSTHGIARFICLAEIDSGYLSLPRGCLDEVEDICAFYDISLKIKDKRLEGLRLENVKFVGSLRSEQTEAIDKLLQYDNGVLHAPTAFGKTVTAIGLICRRKVNTLVLVHNKQLVEQWQERLRAFTQGIEIGVWTGSKKKVTGQVDIATYQSLFNRRDNSVNKLIQDYGQVIVDECHHLSAPQFERVLSESHAKFIVGISATLERRDGHQPIIFMQAGKVRHHIKSEQGGRLVQYLEKKILAFEVP